MEFDNDKNQQLRDELKAYAHDYIHKKDEVVEVNYLTNKRSMNSKLFDQKTDIKSKNILDAEIKFNNQRSTHQKTVFLFIILSTFIASLFYFFAFNGVY